MKDFVSYKHDFIVKEAQKAITVGIQGIQGSIKL